MNDFEWDLVAAREIVERYVSGDKPRQARAVRNIRDIIGRQWLRAALAVGWEGPKTLNPDEQRSPLDSLAPKRSIRLT